MALSWDRPLVWLHRRRRSRKREPQLEAADLVLMSPPKSGRTWLRVMLSHLYHRKYGVPAEEIITFDNFHARVPAIPRFYPTHILNEPEPVREMLRPERLAAKRILLMVRDPRDVLVSARTHFEHRSSASERAMFGLPRSGRLPLEAFVEHPRCGIEALLDLFDLFRRFLERAPQVLLLRYEDLRGDPRGQLARLVRFLGESFTPEQLEETVAFAGFDNLRRLEATGFFRSDILRPGDPRDPRSFKVREGRSGGYRQVLGADLLARIEARIAARLDPRFGYVAGKEGAAAPADCWRQPANSLPARAAGAAMRL